MEPQSSKYISLHQCVKRKMGPPLICEECGATAKEREIQWASVNHDYNKDLTGFRSLCVPCHRIVDGHTGRRGDYCKRGHLVKGDNLVIRERKGRAHPEYGCRECYKIRKDKFNLIRKEKKNG